MFVGHETAIIIEDLQPGATYFFRVCAIADGGNCGPWSEETSCTVAPSSLKNDLGRELCVELRNAVEEKNELAIIVSTLLFGGNKSGMPEKEQGERNNYTRQASFVTGLQTSGSPFGAQS